MRWNMIRSDDRGVTALEYAVILGFIGAMIMPAAYLAAQSIWGTHGTMSSLQTSEIGRGPYQGPDGPVPGYYGQYESVGLGSFQYYGLVAHNGNIFTEVAAYDPVRNVSGTRVSQPYVPGQVNAMYIPETKQTLFGAFSPDGKNFPVLPSVPDMYKYPNASQVWSCGC